MAQTAGEETGDPSCAGSVNRVRVRVCQLDPQSHVGIGYGDDVAFFEPLENPLELQGVFDFIETWNLPSATSSMTATATTAKLFVALLH